MHTNRISPASKILSALGAALGLVLLSGCNNLVLTNLTPSSLPENPSQIYTITLRATSNAETIVPESIKPHIVIDAQIYPMKKSSLADNLYEFEYQLPPGRDALAYYFLVNYETEVNGSREAHDAAYSEVAHATIIHRQVLALVDQRGPVGARVGVLGRGFTPQDVIYLGNTPARTVFESANALSFFVPAMEANHNYRVMLGGASGNSPVGTFRVDASTLTVSPSSLSLRTGEQQTLTFTVPNAAPPGGLLLDVTTDAPESVIMPEVIVPQGQTSVAINVQGGKPGSGSLFLKGYGTGEVTIPVSVVAR